MTTFDEFWNRIDKGALGEGLFNIGTGVYGRNAGNKEAAGKLRTAQGPLYDQNMALSGSVLSRAGGFDPKAAAKERFDTQRGLLAGTDAADEQGLMRMLQSKGLLGLSNFNPGVEGIDPSETAMNPHMAAFYAARNARDRKMSADSMELGEAQLDRQINRAGTLQRNAANTQNAGITAQMTQPSRSAQNMEILKNVGGVLKNSGLFKGGVDWLGDAIKRGFGGGARFGLDDLWGMF